MKRFSVFLVLLAFALVTFAAPLCVIEGVVTDNEGNPLPGVTITIGSRSAVTDANGYWSMHRMPAGRHTVTASLEGFNPVQAIAVAAAGKPVFIQLSLHVTTVSESITVTSVFGGTEARPQYAHFDDNAFVSTKEERVKTFAIDVDRASYANVRRFLNEGRLPPADAVRIEEMVNYFAYDYPQPQGDVPFSITTEVAGCPWNPANRLLRVGIQGKNLEQWKMAPNNLVFLLDVSGSMQPEERLPLIQSAFRLLVEQLRAEDRVAIVVYAGAEGLALPSTSGADKRTILAAIDNLEAGGSTAGAAGIELAYEIAQKHFLEDGNNRVILATDGDFNVGMTSLEEMEALIEKKRKSGIFLSVLGVGDDNHQNALMETLADKGNGNYAYLDSLREAEKVFKHELTGTLVTIAKDMKVQIAFDPAKVASYRQIGYENRALANEDFDVDDEDAGELGAGNAVTALFEIVPTEKRGGPIATLKLRYKEPRAWRSKPIRTEIVDHGIAAQEASRDFQFAAAVAEFGMLLRDSPHKGMSTWDDVLQLAKIARGEDLDGTRQELLTLIAAAKEK